MRRGGRAQRAARWEILPAAEAVTPSITVKPGDTITASTTKGSGSSWTITITHGGKSFTTTHEYAGPQTSAEWIEEAPTVGRRAAPLANYGQTTLTLEPSTALIRTCQGADLMVQKRVQVSTPSNPDGHTDGFNIAHGAAAPAPPPS